MENFDHTIGKSIAGSTVTLFMSFLAHITKDDVLIYVSIIAGLVTIGYTIDRWINLRKKK